jgi:hypothetical protein
MKTRSGRIVETINGCSGGGAEGRVELIVTWGKELFQPLKYHSIEIGPYQMTVIPEKGETMQQAAERTLALLDEIAEAEMHRKTIRFLERIRKLNLLIKSNTSPVSSGAE